MTRITGQQARELLDGTTPGPWEARPNGVVVSYATGAQIQLVGHNQRALGDAPLMAAAPALAETVAWLYGAEMTTDSWGDVEWRRHGGDGNLTLETDRYVEVETFLSDEGGPLVYVTTGPYGETVKLNADEAVEIARALLAAAEVARHQDD